MKRFALLNVLTLLGLFVAPARAHDFWIEPSSFQPAAGTQLKVALRVGERFHGDPVGRSAERIVKFVIADAAGEKPIAGVEGADPAGLVRLDKAGLFVVGYRSNRARVELEAAKFEQYLKEEGLERIITLRAECEESAKPAREVYSRHVKSLVRAGEKKAADARSAAATESNAAATLTGHDRNLGFTLELLSEKNPYAARAGDEFPVRLLYEGKPLEGALVVALNRNEPDKKLSARTDKDGRVTLRLPRAGAWLVKAVHMVPAPRDADADWESFWASLTFEIPD